jgi:transposase
MIEYKSKIQEKLKEYQTLKTPEEKEKMLYEILLCNEDLEIQNAILLEKVSIEKARKFSKKSELTSVPDYYQLAFSDSDLFNEAEIIKETEEVIEYEKITYVRKKKKNSVNKNLGLVEVVVDHTLNDEERNCECCGSGLTHIGYQEVRTYNYIPAKIEILVHNEHSYKCEDCEKETGNTVIKTAKRNTAFPKCMIENNVASLVITKKYLEHVPLYRQEKILRNKGLDVSRANLSNWVIKSGEVLKPIYNLLYNNLLKNDICHMDETTLRVIGDGKKNSYMWGLASSKYDPQAYIYIYKKDRAHHNANDILKGFNGYVHSDGYTAYQRIENTINLGCFAHARRKYVEIMKASHPESTFYKLSSIGKSFIDKLYKIEHRISLLPVEDKFTIRNAESIKVINEYSEWLTATVKTLNVSFAITKAINYSINNLPYLKNFLLDGRLEIDNNRSERMMKSFVIGRKNFLFCFSENGAETSSILYSIIETAYANNIRIEEYLTYLFDTLPNINKDDSSIAKLLPYSSDLPEYLKIKK